MISETQTVKNDIIRTLDFLPLNNLRILAEFAGYLKTENQLPLEQTEADHNDVEINIDSQRKFIRIASPRLANRKQSDDFIMEIIEQ